MSLKLLVKYLLRSVFLIYHLKCNTLSKITCRMLSGKTAYLMKSFPTVMIIFFWGFQNLLMYLWKCLWSLVSSSDLIFQRFFARVIYKTVSLILLKFIKVTKVIRIPSCKLDFIFFIKIMQIKKKADTNFVIFWSRNTIRLFIKTYLNSPIHILRFFKRRNIWKCLK